MSLDPGGREAPAGGGAGAGRAFEARPSGLHPYRVAKAIAFAKSQDMKNDPA